jgi:hypothetical protein
MPTDPDVHITESENNNALARLATAAATSRLSDAVRYTPARWVGHDIHMVDGGVIRVLARDYGETPGISLIEFDRPGGTVANTLTFGGPLTIDQSVALIVVFAGSRRHGN